MEDNTTRILKLANGESIVCTCIPTRIDEASPTLHVIHPLKMELKNKVTKKGIVEALTLSRWLQPFTEVDELDIEKSTIITNAPASYALNNYYNFMVDTYNEAEAQMEGKGMEPSIQPRFTEDVAIEDQAVFPVSIIVPSTKESEKFRYLLDQLIIIELICVYIILILVHTYYT